MNETKEDIPSFKRNMYAIGINKGRKIATKEILEAIDDFLKYDWPDVEECDEFGKGVIWGLNHARQIARDWGGIVDAEKD